VERKKAREEAAKMDPVEAEVYESGRFIFWEM
jgi:hypothetical protein